MGNSNTVDEVAVRVAVDNQVKAGLSAASSEMQAQFSSMQSKVDGLAQASKKQGAAQVSAMLGAKEAVTLATRETLKLGAASSETAGLIGQMAGSLIAGGGIAIALTAVIAIVKAITDAFGAAAAKAEEFNAKQFNDVRAALKDIESSLARAAATRLDLLGGKGSGELAGLKKGLDSARQALLDFGAANKNIYNELRGLTKEEQADYLALAETRFGNSSRVYQNIKRYITMEAELARAQTDYLAAQDLIRGNSSIEAAKKLGDEQAKIIQQGASKTEEEKRKYIEESNKIALAARKAGLSDEQKIQEEYSEAIAKAQETDWDRRANLRRIRDAQLAAYREAQEKATEGRIYQLKMATLGDEEKIRLEYDRRLSEANQQSAEEIVAIEQWKQQQIAELEKKRAEETSRLLAQSRAEEAKAVAETKRRLADMQRSAEAYAAPVKAMMDDLIDGILSGHASMSDAMKALWVSLAKMVVGKLWEMATAHIAAMAVETAAKQTAATAQVTADAAAAGAETAKQTSTIPFVGPAIAVAAGLAMMAAIIAAMKIKSAARGYDIPSTVSSHILEVHRDEMVLPAHIANPLREQLRNNGGTGMTVNISAIDGPSVQRVVESKAFSRAMREARANGRL